MRILIDTNILVSATLSEAGLPHQAVLKALESPYQVIICQQSIDELWRVYQLKFPESIGRLGRFLSAFLPFVEVVAVPPGVAVGEEAIRDTDDRPIFRTAVHAKADIILTGDKDFLESDITAPRMVTAREFIAEE